jgi:hypothetical protein
MKDISDTSAILDSCPCYGIVIKNIMSIAKLTACPTGQLRHRNYQGHHQYNTGKEDLCFADIANITGNTVSVTLPEIAVIADDADP